MVRAILNGEKTVTRRIVNPDWVQSDRAPLETSAGEFYFWCSGTRKCPYGEPGERLWVREAWIADAQVNSIAPRELSQGEPIFYPADGHLRQAGCSMISRGKCRPSIHMPRWASRILLEITAVRVERLQDISDEQARAEGYPADRAAETGGSDLDAWLWFRSLWGEINGPEAFAANPLVWVVEFKRVEGKP